MDAVGGLCGANEWLPASSIRKAFVFGSDSVVLNTASSSGGVLRGSYMCLVFIS